MEAEMRKMRLRRAVAALTLSAAGLIGFAAPVSAAPTTTVTTLTCVGKYPVSATYSLTARQVTALKALVRFIDSHPALFATTCTVTP
jgi:hypothetical protein